ncbi:HNH endonuclease [Longibaculum muris]|uniref:HNH endonuclease n=1 Tax=Longibaculum muris TaxID=1796628 RepID=UPI0037C9F1A8
MPVDEVHHKLPLSEGGTHERSNLIALCKSCHAKIHAERGDYQGSKKHRVYSYDK